MGTRAPTMMLECDLTIDSDGCAGFAFGGSEDDETYTALCLDAGKGLLHYEGFEIIEDLTSSIRLPRRSSTFRRTPFIM